MKVSELIVELQNMDPESEVILQKDADGKGYSPLADVNGSAIYRPESTWHGYVYCTGWSANDAGFEPDEWDRFKRENPRCCVLAPIN